MSLLLYGRIKDTEITHTFLLYRSSDEVSERATVYDRLVRVNEAIDQQYPRRSVTTYHSSDVRIVRRDRDRLYRHSPYSTGIDR